jgi:aminoglycoside phosphotransferase family enzyme/predicted kinase
MPDTLAAHEELVGRLLRADAYPHPVDRVQRIDTHISTVLLAGAFAYKLKKPVDLGFVDFTTAARRRRFCEAELRVNRAAAPQLYLDVVPVLGPPAAPRFGAAGDGGPALEVAVRMRRFDQEQLLDRLARCGALGEADVDALARVVARLHAGAPRAAPGLGTPEVALRWARENLDALRVHAAGAQDRARLDALARWTEAEARARHGLMADRVAAGFVRECHGDLHLGNVVRIDGAPVPFDAIEFNDELRSIDVMSDASFAFMDLLDHGRPDLAWRFISGYLEAGGDYAGLPLLRFYAVYRALVRAKVAQIRAQQPRVDLHARLHAHAGFAQDLALAERLTRRGPALLLVMTGLSGSGKSTVALHLVQALGAVRVRSDVERKRLFGLAPEAATGAALYGAEATARTYERLAGIARIVVDAGVPAIVDAAFLRRDERLRFRALAAALGARHVLVSCEAPVPLLRERVAARAARGGDPSEATVEVLERQTGWREAPAEDERADLQPIDTSATPAVVGAAARRLARRLLAG